MTEMNAVANVLYRKGQRRMKKASLRIDMTPMVDLGFLLICFFVFTTSISQPYVMKLYMPKEGPPIHLQNSNSLTIMLDKGNKIFFYHGNWEEAIKSNAIYSTGYSANNGLGHIIREKQKWLDETKAGEKGRAGLMLLIKASPEANYKNLIDALDEVLINDINAYAVVELTEEEQLYLNQSNH